MKNIKRMVITFCGHSNFEPTPEIERKLLGVLEQYNTEPLQFLCGGYGSFDGFAARCCRKFKEQHPATKVILVVPYQDEEYLKRNKEYFALFDEIEYPLERKVPQRYAILERNKKMVEEADVVIGYIKRTWGGAHETFQYAIKKQKVTHNLFEF